MADSSRTPPPKDVVTTRSPTPNPDTEEVTGGGVNAPPPTISEATPVVADTQPSEVNIEQTADTPAAPEKEPSVAQETSEIKSSTVEEATVADDTIAEDTVPGAAVTEPAEITAEEPVEDQSLNNTTDKPKTPAATSSSPKASSPVPKTATPPPKSETPPPKSATPPPKITTPHTAKSATPPIPEAVQSSNTPTATSREAAAPPSKETTTLSGTGKPGSQPSSPLKETSNASTKDTRPASTSKPITPSREKTGSPAPSTPAAAVLAPPPTGNPPPATASTRETSMIAESTMVKTPGIPDAPYQRDDSMSRMSGGDESNIITGNALSVVWSFGLNKNVPMVNLSTDERSIIMYACAHTGIAYNFENSASTSQKLLQGHNNNISSICVSEDKRWLATADRGPNNCMVIIWDTNTFFPTQTIFDAGEQGVVAMALTPDARYLVTISASAPQVVAIWDWTVEGDRAVCTATLDPSYGVQNYVLFNPDDTTQIVSNSESQAIFYSWNGGEIEYFCPPLTDDDFNKPVGKFTQSVFLPNTNKAVTATSIGNLVVWASNKPLTKAVDDEPTPNKKALKLVKVQDRGINVLMTSDAFIVMGDMNGHVKLFDQSLNLLHWYQDLHIGPINAISFTYIEKWGLDNSDMKDYPNDCSLESNPLSVRDFVVGSTQSVYAMISPKGTDINVILRNHDSPIHTILPHPSEPKLFIGSYSGLLQMWNYETREVIASKKFNKNLMIQCAAIDPKGQYVAVGFTNGVVKVLDALNLLDENTESFRYSRDAITLIKFSHDSQYLACADGEFTTTLLKYQGSAQPGAQPWIYVGRHKAHYKPIQDLIFGVHLDNDKPRLLTLGKDRVLVEYNLEASSKDNLVVDAFDRIEQSAVPGCMTWYPPLNKEHFLLTANDQFKFKLYNVTTKRCRKTCLGPTYGSPLKKICIMPTLGDGLSKYMAYVNHDKIGLQILPLDGNPHNAMALVAHPSGISDMVASFDGKYLFTAGGVDTTVHMWHVNLNALEAQSKLGGEGLIPFYGLMEGGRDGELFAELEDYFYYAQLRSQGINTMMNRQVATKIPLSEVPYVMRAMGYYPSEQEVEDMLNEVKFSQYVETGEDVVDIDLEGFIKLYVNHRPAFGLSLEKIAWCFEVLKGEPEGEAAIRRGHFLDLLQRKGEHMTEYELSEYLTTLLGFNEEGGSCEQHEFDASSAGNIIIDNMPTNITTKAFTDDLLMFGMFEEQSQPDILVVNNE